MCSASIHLLVIVLVIHAFHLVRRRLFSQKRILLRSLVRKVSQMTMGKRLLRIVEVNEQVIWKDWI